MKFWQKTEKKTHCDFFLTDAVLKNPHRKDNLAAMIKKSPRKTKGNKAGVVPSPQLAKRGARIKKARKALRLTQEQVATRLRMSRATIVQVEKGRTVLRYDKMQRLLQALNIS